jgi:hypothetical protein
MQQKYRNTDNTSNVVEIDLQIIVDEYSKKVERLEKRFAEEQKNTSTYGLENDIVLVLALLISQSLWENQYFKQLEALKARAYVVKDEIDKLNSRLYLKAIESKTLWERSEKKFVK